MNWIFVGILLGSVVTSHHETREACEGRATILKEKGVSGQCVSIYTGGQTLQGPYTISPGVQCVSGCK